MNLKDVDLSLIEIFRHEILYDKKEFLFIISLNVKNKSFIFEDIIYRERVKISKEEKEILNRILSKTEQTLLKDESLIVQLSCDRWDRASFLIDIAEVELTLRISCRYSFLEAVYCIVNMNIKNEKIHDRNRYLEEENKKLKEENILLRNQIDYSPDGDGYLEAKEDFARRAEGQK